MSDDELDEAVATVACYFLLTDIEFKNERQRSRTCRRCFWVHDGVKKEIG